MTPPPAPQNPQPNANQPNGYAYAPNAVPMGNPADHGYSGAPANGPYQANGYGPQNNQATYIQAPLQDPGKGRGLAIASLIIGICGAVFFCLGISWAQLLVLSMLLGIIGIVLAAFSKRSGYRGTVRTAGFITSIIVVAVSGVFLVSCIGCVGFLDSSDPLKH